MCRNNVKCKQYLSEMCQYFEKYKYSFIIRKYLHIIKCKHWSRDKYKIRVKCKHQLSKMGLNNVGVLFATPLLLICLAGCFVCSYLYFYFKGHRRMCVTILLHLTWLYAERRGTGNKPGSERVSEWSLETGLRLLQLWTLTDSLFAAAALRAEKTRTDSAAVFTGWCNSSQSTVSPLLLTLPLTPADYWLVSDLLCCHARCCRQDALYFSQPAAFLFPSSAALGLFSKQMLQTTVVVCF